MLLDSELVKHIDFNVRVKIKERYVELIQSIDPFLAYPLFPKASDLAQGAAVTYNILNKIDPVSKQTVKGAKSKGDEGLSTISSKKIGSILTKTKTIKRSPAKTSSSPQEKSRVEEVEVELSQQDPKQVHQESRAKKVIQGNVGKQSSALHRATARKEEDSEEEELLQTQKNAANFLLRIGMNAR